MWRCVLEDSGGACAFHRGITHLLMALSCAINLDSEVYQVRVLWQHVYIMIDWLSLQIRSASRPKFPEMVLDQYLEALNVRVGSRILVNATGEPFSMLH